MALFRLLLYVVTAAFNFSVALSLWRLPPWLAKIFALSLFSVVATSILYAVLLMEKMAWFDFSSLTSEIIFMTNTVISAASAIALAVVFYRKNGEADRGL